MSKKALGKGLGAFFPGELAILREERYAEVDVDQIRPSPHQPRRKFDEQTIEELAQSMKETGILQPVIVVPEEDHYRIVVGERRWRAAQKIGLKKIPALVRPIPYQQQIEISLIENLHREDLTPLEIASAYQKLMEELHYTQEEVARKVGKDRSSVANYLRLLRLPEEVQRALAEGKISMGHARALISLEDPELQVSLCRKIVDKNLSVRDVEKAVNKLKAGVSEERAQSFDPNLEALQDDLIKLLGTKVLISGNSEKGVIKIYYFSCDELNRIYEKVKGENS